MIITADGLTKNASSIPKIRFLNGGHLWSQSHLFKKKKKSILSLKNKFAQNRKRDNIPGKRKVKTEISEQSKLMARQI